MFKADGSFEFITQILTPVVPAVTYTEFFHEEEKNMVDLQVPYHAVQDDFALPAILQEPPTVKGQGKEKSVYTVGFF